MWANVTEAARYLQTLPLEGLILSFWFVVILEIPHYMLSFIAVALSVQTRRRQAPIDAASLGRVSVVIAGYNEQDAIGRCVASLREQTLVPDEVVIVSDGSTDRMPQELRRLRAQGLIDKFYCTDARAGKSAAINLAVQNATGDFVVNIDCDCSLDRYAIQELVKPFANPRVGAVCGNIFVRNADASLLTKFQAIEYLISISLGKTAAALIDQVVCVSGAFGAFRRTAYVGVYGGDPGGGEDLDLTMRLRKAGWRIAFAPDAIVSTDVPVTARALLRQRFRWDRDALGLRFRKHGDLINPFSAHFRPAELVHEIEFIVFTVLPAAGFPVYLFWLFDRFGRFGGDILLATQGALAAFDFVALCLAALVNPKAQSLALLPYLLGYSLYSGYFMRLSRLTAFIQEWIFSASRNDPYVPEKVLRTRSW